MHMRDIRTLRLSGRALLLFFGLFAFVLPFAEAGGNGEAGSPTEAGAEAAGTRTAEETVTLELGYMPILPVAQFFIVAGEGWAQEAGIEFNLTRFPDGPSMVQALASGRLDVMHFGIGPAMVARSRGQEIKVVASSIIEQIGFIARENLAAYYDPDNPAALFGSFEEGEGRKARIASFPRGSVPDTVLRYWLEERLEVGVSAAEIVGMGADNVQQALLSGNVDGAATLEPILTIVSERDPSTEVLARADELFPGQPGAVLALRERLLNEQPEVVQALVEMHIRATNFLRNNISRSAEHIAEFIGQGLVDVSLLEQALRSPSTNYMANPNRIIEPTRRMHDFQLETGSLAQEVPLEDLFDTSFYDQAVE